MNDRASSAITWTDEAIAEVMDAIDDADYWFHAYKRASDPMAQAHALLSLASAMADLRSWHPQYDPDVQGIIPGSSGREPDVIAGSKGLPAPTNGSEGSPA
ncbi:MAG TPA: hypothetical protein VFK52_00130 [Nocardioidaceae bacterium]|nr:hypothetical protein [Nocardioidaceae bacterium]